MERKTGTLEELEVAGARAAYDAACKRLLAQKHIAAWILKGCMAEYRDVPVDVIVRECLPGGARVLEEPVHAGALPNAVGGEDAGSSEGAVRYDVRFDAALPGSAGSVDVLVNVEAQRDFHPGYPLVRRGVYYACRMVSSQRGTYFFGDDYGKLRKVCSVWVCTDPPVGRRNTVTSYDLVEHREAGDAGSGRRDYDLLRVVQVCLGPPGGAGYTGVVKLLGTLLSGEVPLEEKRSVLEGEFGVPMTEQIEGEVRGMVHPVDAAWYRGLAEGKIEGAAEGERRGRREGKREGRREGLTEGVLSSLRNLMANAGVPLEQAMAMLGVPEDERATYAGLIGR